MDTVYFLQRVLDYIHENLKTEISSDELATISTFSVDHFNHMFKDYVGMPVFTYITKCRLDSAIYCVKHENIKLIDAALEHGFNTHAGFFKAFKRQYGCSPSKYLKISVIRKPKKINLRKDCRTMFTQTQIKRYLKNWDGIDSSSIENAYGLGGRLKQDNVWFIGDEYVLKTGKDVPGLRTHIDLINALEREGMKQGSAIKTIDGEDFLLEDDRYFALFKKIDGKMLMVEERFKGDVEETGKKYGEAIAEMQSALKKQEANLEVKDSDMLKTVLTWAMPSTKRIMEQWGCPLPEEFYNDFENRFTELFPKLKHEVIHRDANPSNILFKDGKVVGFVDFEISSRNLRIFDPCYCATGILAESDKREDDYLLWKDMLKGIIDGYNSVCELSKEERDAIPYVIYGIEMIVIAYLDGKDEYKNASLDNRNMILWMWENRENCFEI